MTPDGESFSGDRTVIHVMVAVMRRKDAAILFQEAYELCICHSVHLIHIIHTNTHFGKSEFILYLLSCPLELAAEGAGEDGLFHAVDGGKGFLRRLPGALLTREQAVEDADDFLLLGRREYWHGKAFDYFLV